MTLQLVNRRARGRIAAALDGLQRQVAVAEFPNVFDLDVVDFLHRRRGGHLDTPTQEQDPLRQDFNMAHFFYGSALEQTGQQIEALIVAVEMEVLVVDWGLVIG